MPYNNKRRYNRKRPNYRRRRPANTRRVAYKALKVAKKASARSKPEKFFLDTTFGGTIGTSAAVIPLNQLAQPGRDGQQIYNLHVSGHLFADNTAPAAATTIRWAIVKDNQQRPDTDPTQAQIFQTTSVMSPLNSDSRGRFSVLYDRRMTLTSNGDTRKFWKVFVPLKFRVYFNGVAATDIQRNGVYLIVYSDKSTNLPSYGYYLRLAFYDQ